LTLLAAIAILAPVNSQIKFKRTTCQINSDTGACCCESADCEAVAGAEMSCCSGEIESTGSDNESPTSPPYENDGGCPCGNCNCRVIISCGQAMPFLVAPAMVTGSNNPFVNSLPVPNMNVTGDACLQGVFHPPRC